jgi:dTDP-4-amino-4,6-dideoxygalactose transaminase
MPGINGKMNELQAAIGIVLLEYVAEERAKRKYLIECYKNCLKDMEGITFLEDQVNIKGNYQYFTIRIDEKLFGCSRDFIYEQFKEYNVFTRKYFYPLCSEYTCYKQLPSSSAINLPVANQVVREVLSMPLYGELSTSDIERICDILKEIRIRSFS